MSKKLNILIYDVAAETSGALSILIDFYNSIKDSDLHNDYHFIFALSSVHLDPNKFITVLSFPWIKRSWFHRLFFDFFISPRIIKKYHISKVLSLQNTILPLKNIDQIVYLHNALPFSDYKYKFFNNRYLWIYQNLIGIFIKYSLLKAKHIIVQTESMKNRISSQLNIHHKSIFVVPPIVKVTSDEKFSISALKEPITFFYPATAFDFKNHSFILKVSKILKERKIPHKVIFTLKENDNNLTKAMYKKISKEKLTIDFIGYIDRFKLMQYYSKSILIFPSRIESFPLPLIEAMIHRSIILSSNLDFSKEVLKKYKNAYFFDLDNLSELSDLMEKIVLKQIHFIKDETDYINTSTSIVDVLLKS
jgi:glycosyltransferase involved in cell wall biosynthesis